MSSLSSLVRWYQEHSQSCPHEPELTALEVQPSRSATAVWQCDSDHSFVQYLSSPPREASDSGEEGGSDGECSAEEMLEEDLEEKRKSDEELGGAEFLFFYFYFFIVFTLFLFYPFFKSTFKLVL